MTTIHNIKQLPSLVHLPVFTTKIQNKRDVLHSNFTYPFGCKLGNSKRVFKEDTVAELISGCKLGNSEHLLAQFCKEVRHAYINTVQYNRSYIRGFCYGIYGKCPTLPEKEISTLKTKVENFRAKVNVSPLEVKRVIEKYLNQKIHFCLNGNFIPLAKIEKAYFMTLNKESYSLIKKTLFSC